MGVAIDYVSQQALQVPLEDLQRYQLLRRLSTMEAEDGRVDREPGIRDNSEGDRRAEVSDPVPSTNDDMSAQPSTGTPRTTLSLSTMEAEDGRVDREPGTRDNSEGGRRAEVSDPVPSTNDDMSAQSSTGTPRTTLSLSTMEAEDGRADMEPGTRDNSEGDRRAEVSDPVPSTNGSLSAQSSTGTPRTTLSLSPMEAEDGRVDREPGTRDNSEGDRRAEVSDPVPSTNDDTSAQSSTGTPRTTLSKRSSSSSAEDGPLSKKTRGTETRGTGSNNMLLTALENSIRDSSTTQVRIQQTETQNSHMGLQVQVVQQIPRDHADQDIPIQQDYTSQGGDVDNEIEPESVSISEDGDVDNEIEPDFVPISEDGDVDNEIEPEFVTISDNDDCDMATPDVTYYVLQLNNALAELAPIPPRSGSWQEGSLSHELDPLPPRVSNEQESSHSLECDPIPPSARNGQEDSLALDTNAPRAGNEIEVSLSLDPIPSRANNELNHIPHPMAGNGQEGLLSPDPIPPRAANELDPNPPPRAGDGREGPLELDPIPPRAGNGQQFLNYPEYMEFDSPDPEFVNIFSYPDEEDINMDDYPSY